MEKRAAAKSGQKMPVTTQGPSLGEETNGQKLSLPLKEFMRQLVQRNSPKRTEGQKENHRKDIFTALPKREKLKIIGMAKKQNSE